MGIVVNYNDLTAETVEQAIRKALAPEMQASAKKVAFSYRYRPEKPVELAMWWVEYVAAMKGSPLTKSSSTYMSGFVYHSLDVYSLLVGIVVGFITILVLLIKLCGCCCDSREKQKNIA